MHIRELQKNWHEFGKIDPLWAILAFSNKKENRWQIDEFFRMGVLEVEAVMQSVASLGITIKDGKALDFGCGVGRLSQALSSYYCEVYGVDIAPSMIELAKKYNKYTHKCTYYLNETDDLKLFTDNNFDFIYTSIVLQHMEPQYIKSYIKEFLRVLSPHGLLIFQLPEPLEQHRESLYNILKKFIKYAVRKIFSSLYKKSDQELRKNPESPIMEMYGIRREEVIKLLEDNGGKILDIRDHIDDLVKFSRDYRSKFADIIDIMPEEIQMIIEGYEPAEVTTDVHARYGVSFRYCVTKE